MIRPLLLGLALLAPVAAFAQSASLPPASDAPQAATPPTVSGDAPSGGRYGRMNMSPEMRQVRQAMVQSCSADFAKFCGGSQQGGDGQGASGGGARMQCLRQHASEVSDGCRSSMQAMRAARQGAASPTGSPQS